MYSGLIKKQSDLLSYLENILFIEDLKMLVNMCPIFKTLCLLLPNDIKACEGFNIIPFCAFLFKT